MRVKKFELTLEDGRVMTCSKAGEGKRIGYIVGGPGSFYFNGLSSLQEDYSFVTCDKIWTCRKLDSLANKKNISSITKETIKEQDHLVVQALKKNFNVESIDGFGFSAPGSLLFEEALEHPEDFTHIIGTGIGLIELDATFSKTNSIFYESASPERRQAFDVYQAKYKKFESFSNEQMPQELDLFSFFALRPTSAFPLKPHEKFLAETIAMAPKLLSNFSNHEASKDTIVAHWGYNPFKEHIDKNMQEHFFANIYPHITPLSTLLNLARKGKKILLVYGNLDFVTPLTEEIETQLRHKPNISLHVIPNCSHMVYVESKQEYASIVSDFINV